MNYHVVAGIVLFLLGLVLIMAGASGISMRDAGEIDKKHPLFIVASFSFIFSFIYNLVASLISWRDMKVELILLCVGTVMSLSGELLCLR
jgi:uncharacterized membrane protein